MQWIYMVTAEDRPRVQSRVMQVFDRQLILVDTFVSVRFSGQVWMRIAGDTAACSGERLKALLLHLEDVLAVCALPSLDDKEHAATCEILKKNWPVAAGCGEGAARFTETAARTQAVD